MLLTSCAPTQYKGVIINKSVNVLRVEVEVTKTHYISAAVTIEQLDTLNVGAFVVIDRKTLSVIK